MPWFSAIMFQKCFRHLLRFLHLHDNENEVPKDYPNYSNLFKLGRLQDSVRDSFGSMYHPNQCKSIDEHIIGTKCCIGFIQFMPKKTQKFGVKVWTLCESTSGYFIQFQIYTGESPDSAERGLLRRVFF